MATSVKPKVKAPARAKLTPEEKLAKLEQDLIKAKQELYGSKLSSLVSTLRLPDLLKKIKDEVKGADNVTIAAALIEGMGIKGVQVTAGKSKEKKERVTYSAETKAAAVKAVKDGKAKADVARQYSITPSTLANWIKKA